MEVLRDLLPKVTRIGVLVNPADAGATEAQLTDIEAAARAMGLQIKVYNADTGAEIDAAFEAMGRDPPDAVVVGVSAFLNGRRVPLAHLATFYRLPAIYGVRDFVEVGGLISYGGDIIDALPTTKRSVPTGFLPLTARSQSSTKCCMPFTRLNPPVLMVRSRLSGLVNTKFDGANISRS